MGPGALEAMIGPGWAARSEQDVWRELGWIEWSDAAGSVWFCADCADEHGIEAT